MEPLDFMDVAIAFQASPAEAERRTAVGRSYYAAFNHVRDLIRAAGRPVTVKDAHACVLHYLRGASRGLREVGTVHTALSSMRDSRVVADYEMTATIHAADSQAAVRRGQAVIAALEGVSQERLAGALRSVPAFQPRE